MVEVPPLTSVAVACRSSIGHVEELVRSIDAFIGIAKRWTVPLVCAEESKNTLPWLPRAAAQEPPHVDPLVKRKLFAEAMDHAVRRGDLTVVRWLVEVYLPTGRIRQAVDTAAAHGQLEILQWLKENHDSRVVWGHKELALAAKGDHVATAKWLIENADGSVGGDDRLAMMRGAMEHGNVAMLELLCRIDEEALDESHMRNAFMLAAARNGQLDVMQSHSRLGWSSAQKYMAIAMGNGHLELAQWLFSCIGIKMVDVSALIEASRNGHLEVIKWSLDNLTVKGEEHSPSAIDSASAWGHLDVVKYLHEHWRGRASVAAMNYAAYGGHFEVVKWLHEYRSEGCTTLAMDLAAFGGYLDIVEWLHEHRTEGCTTRAMDAAAANGHLELVQWLHENRTEGCTADAMDGAAGSNHLALLKWLHAKRHEGCTNRAMDQAAANGHLAVLQWLQWHQPVGCSTGVIDVAAANGHLEVVEWLSEHRSQVATSRGMIGAAKNGHLPVVEWLHSKGIDGSPDDAMRSAVQFGRLDVVQWLMANFPPREGDEALKYAISGGYFEIVVALCEDERTECTLDCFRAAIQREEPEILQFLMREFGEQTPGALDFIRDRTARHSPASVYIRDCIAELAVMDAAGNRSD